MSRNSVFALPFLAGVASIAACATGSDVGGDPASSTSSTDPGDSGATGSDAGATHNDSGQSTGTDSGASNDDGTDSGSNDEGTDSGSKNGTDSGAGSTCVGYAPPDTAAACVDTQYCGVKGKPACNANGCDTTYYCELSSKNCVKKPSGC